MALREFARSIALLTILLTGSAAAIVNADDLIKNAAVSHDGDAAGQVQSRAATGSPLLPCPKSIPCLPLAGYGETARPSAAVASKGLLPCPFSVPCFTAGPNTDLHTGARPASLHGSYPTARRRAHFSDRGASSGTREVRFRTRITVKRLNPAGSRRGSSAKMGPAGDMALCGDFTYEQRARSLLQEAEQKLGRVDPTRLGTNQSQVYAKASDLTTAGLKALQANDNLAALAFAEKARILIASL